jgi:oxygen-independent coproporphyrinogen-3 oxidase
MNTLNEMFNISSDAEITIECNPDDINSEKIKFWKTNKINRVSLGIQSFDDSDLKLMNRSHNSQQALHSLDLIK